METAHLVPARVRAAAPARKNFQRAARVLSTPRHPASERRSVRDIDDHKEVAVVALDGQSSSGWYGRRPASPSRKGCPSRTSAAGQVARHCARTSRRASDRLWLRHLLQRPPCATTPRTRAALSTARRTTRSRRALGAAMGAQTSLRSCRSVSPRTPGIQRRSGCCLRRPEEGSSPSAHFLRKSKGPTGGDGEHAHAP